MQIDFMHSSAVKCTFRSYSFKNNGFWQISETGCSAGKGKSSLRESAQVLLRALYERDVRRAFCPPTLWLAPYEALTYRADFTARAVVNALLKCTSEEGR